VVRALSAQNAAEKHTSRGLTAVMKNIRFAGKKAAEGIRTLDLLHGKQTL